MSGETLEKGLRRVGLRQRWVKVAAWWSFAGAGIAAASQITALSPYISALGLLPLMYIFAPVSLAAVARKMHEENGDEPDVLCAVEHLRVDDGLVVLQRERVRQRVMKRIEDWPGRRRLVWLVLLPLWGSPLLGGVKQSGVPPYANEAEKAISGSDAEIKPDPAAVKASEGQKKKSLQNEKDRPPNKPKKAQAAKGQTASETGVQNREKSSKVRIEKFGGAQTLIDGIGSGGVSAQGKLTPRPKDGSLKVLVKDRLDPSEKYPVEYREAIQEWFLKRK